METTDVKQNRTFRNVGVLDLRNATDESVAGIAIGDVGTVIYSADTAHLMSRISMGNVGASVESSKEARFINGHLTIDRGFFKNSGDPSTIFVNGHIVFEPNVPAEDIEAGLAGLIVNGHILYPESLAGVVQSKLRRVNGHTQSYQQGDRLLTGRVTLDENFLRSLDDNTSLVMVGRLYIPRIDDGNLLEQKIRNIKGRGRIRFHEENSDTLLPRMGESMGRATVAMISTGYRLIDTPIVIDDSLLRTLSDSKLYCTDRVVIDAEVSPALLDEKLDALTAQGIVICPQGLKDTLTSKLGIAQSRPVFYEGELWLIEDEMELVASRLDFLDDMATIVNMGELVIDPEIEPRTLADKLAKVHNFGEIRCTRGQMGAIQARLGLSEGELIDSSKSPDTDGGSVGHLTL